MAEPITSEKEKIVVQRSGGGSVGGALAGLALLIAVLGILKYFGMLPF